MQAYENLKQKAKKSVSDCKVAQLQTGGGPCVPLPDDVTEKVLMVLGNRAKPLENCFDSDAAYNCEAGANDAVTFPVSSDCIYLCCLNCRLYLFSAELSQILPFDDTYRIKN